MREKKEAKPAGDERKIHCPNCWEELQGERWTRDYKGCKWVTCPMCGERVCLNPNE